MTEITKNYDVVVIGGGIGGMCSAIAAARHGAKTALIQNRSVLGGNASGEIRMHIVGADRHATRKNARETGIIEEILLKNKATNPEYSFPVFDALTWEFCSFQPNLDLYLNTHIDSVDSKNNRIISVSGVQQTSEKKFIFNAEIFVDSTGDGTIGALCGAEYMYGREDKNQFNEPHGKDKPDDYTMGSSIMFAAKDTGHPVSFTKPFWAHSYTEEQLKNRDHTDGLSGYWWIEIGGDELKTIIDAENIRDELLKITYGIWDHIKNGGNHGAENYSLEWVCMIPGKRESRRLTGDYVLTENDLVNTVHFNDAVAYGGWAIDDHIIGGMNSKNDEPTKYIELPKVYEIPYRCLVSKNISNLMLGGRAISASHLAFASTRVMGTCAVVGQAIGTAAAMAIKLGIQTKGIYNHIFELQQTLLRDDCYIPNIKNCDENDLAASSKVSGSNQSAKSITNGVSRSVENAENCYVSNGIPNGGDCVLFEFNGIKRVSSIEIKFDSNLSKEIMITISKWAKSNQIAGTPPQLVKDYDLLFYNGKNIVKTIKQRNNYQRFNRVNLEVPTECDKIAIKAYSTHGDKNIRIFEVRVY